MTKSSSMALHKPHSIYMDPRVRYRAQLGLTLNGVWSRSLWFSLRFGKGRPLHEGSSAPEFGFCPFRVREFFSWTKADERPKLALPVRDPARGSGTDKERQGWPPQKGSQNSEPAQRHGRAVALGEEFPLSFRSIHAVGQGGRGVFFRRPKKTGCFSSAFPSKRPRGPIGKWPLSFFYASEALATGPLCGRGPPSRGGRREAVGPLNSRVSHLSSVTFR